MCGTAGSNRILRLVPSSADVHDEDDDEDDDDDVDDVEIEIGAAALKENDDENPLPSDDITSTTSETSAASAAETSTTTRPKSPPIRLPVNLEVIPESRRERGGGGGGSQEKEVDSVDDAAEAKNAAGANNDAAAAVVIDAKTIADSTKNDNNSKVKLKDGDRGQTGRVVRPQIVPTRKTSLTELPSSSRSRLHSAATHSGTNIGGGGGGGFRPLDDYDLKALRLTSGPKK